MRISLRASLEFSVLVLMQRAQEFAKLANSKPVQARRGW